jgi:hypothetical protein
MVRTVGEHSTVIGIFGTELEWDSVPLMAEWEKSECLSFSGRDGDSNEISILPFLRRRNRLFYY